MDDANDITNVLLFQIDLTGKIAKQYSQRKLDERGVNITVDQWVLLKIIQESDRLSQRELALKSKRDPASITRTLDILVKKGLAVREGIEGNRRQYEVVLTEGGKAFIDHNLPEIIEHRNLSVRGISQSDLKKTFDVLTQIQSNMR